MLVIKIPLNRLFSGIKKKVRDAIRAPKIIIPREEKDTACQVFFWKTLGTNQRTKKSMIPKENVIIPRLTSVAGQNIITLKKIETATSLRGISKNTEGKREIKK